MNPDNDDARLEAWINRQAAAEPLPDAGFSARVLEALPPPRAFRWQRLGVWVGGALVGALATRLDVGEWPTLASAVEPFGEPTRMIGNFFSHPWIMAALCGAVMIAAAVAAIRYAFRDEESTGPLE